MESRSDPFDEAEPFLDFFLSLLLFLRAPSGTPLLSSNWLDCIAAAVLWIAALYTAVLCIAILENCISSASLGESLSIAVSFYALSILLCILITL